MRAIVQRVTSAQVEIGHEKTGSIQKGLLILLGIAEGDDLSDVTYLANKVLNLRIFEDSDGKMNLSVQQIKGELLVVSQFTLFGDCRKGNRPSFVEAAPPEKAKQLYQSFIEKLNESGLLVESGQFQAEMEVILNNQGPVTILLDSQKLF